MKRIAFGFISVFFGALFWWAFDAEHPSHQPFEFFDQRTVLGLIAWCSVSAALAAGRVALSSSHGANTDVGEGQ